MGPYEAADGGHTQERERRREVARFGRELTDEERVWAEIDQDNGLEMSDEDAASIHPALRPGSQYHEMINDARHIITGHSGPVPEELADFWTMARLHCSREELEAMSRYDRQCAIDFILLERASGNGV